MIRVSNVIIIASTVILKFEYVTTYLDNHEIACNFFYWLLSNHKGTESSSHRKL